MIVLLGIPTDRIVAFFGPIISLIAGLVAAWLVAKVNITGVKGLDQANLTTYIGAGLSFGVATGVTWLGHSKWLTGRHVEMQGQLAKEAASIFALAGSGRPVSAELATLVSSLTGTPTAAIHPASSVGNVAAQGPTIYQRPQTAAEPQVFSTPPVPGAPSAQVVDENSQGEQAATDGDAQAPTGPTLPEEV